MLWKWRNHHEELKSQLPIHLKFESKPTETNKFLVISSQLSQIIVEYIKNKKKDHPKLQQVVTQKKQSLWIDSFAVFDSQTAGHAEESDLTHFI